MLVLCARAAATRGNNKPYRKARLGLIGAALAALLAGGCATAPPTSLLAPGDPGARVPAVRYSSVTAPYTRQRPVEPLPWRERNERVVPQAGQ
ncbi:MAG TPA: hypothetical protein VFK79_12105 [Xanthobacteraceae bacterium]|nr:hypothetical protein [Xanthobacteraceae bacterium]